MNNENKTPLLEIKNNEDSTALLEITNNESSTNYLEITPLNRIRWYNKIFPLRKPLPIENVAINQAYRWRNIHLSLAQMGFFTFLTFIAAGGIFDAYIFLTFEKENSWVGFLDGSSGLVIFLVIVPFGILNDKYNRELFSKCTSFFFLVSTITGVIAISNGTTELLFSYIVAINISCQSSMAVVIPTLTDSMKRIEYVKYFTLRAIISSGVMSIGSIISIIYFNFFGDEWQIPNLKNLLIILILFSGPPLSIIHLFYRNVNPHLVEDVDIKSLNLTNQACSNGSDPSAVDDEIPLEDKEIAFNSMNSEDSRFSMMTRTNKKVPYVLMLNSVLYFFSIGLSTKYFQLYFIEQFGLPPKIISIIYLCQSIFIGIFVSMTSWLSNAFGRPLVSLVTTLLSILSLGIMTLSSSALNSIIFFIIRGMFSTCHIPIDQSLMMDYTRIKNRGKWNAAKSFAIIFMSIGSLLGGLISDSKGYLVTFSITIICSLLSTLLYAPILIMVLDEDKPRLPRIELNRLIRPWNIRRISNQNLNPSSQI